MRTLLQLPLHCLLQIFLLLALSLACSHARAGAGTVDDRTQIIKDFVLQIPYLKKRFDGNSNSATEYPIVLMVTAESEFLKGLQLEDPAIIIMPQADVVAAQLASFASLSNLMVDGEHAVMRYDIPASDRSGEIRFRKKAGRWHKPPATSSAPVAGRAPTTENSTWAPYAGMERRWPTAGITC